VIRDESEIRDIRDQRSGIRDQGFVRDQETGGVTFAQKEALMRGIGIPREATTRGAVQSVHSLSVIGPAILSANERMRSR
jgi:chemotaxis response regulator CheB